MTFTTIINTLTSLVLVTITYFYTKATLRITALEKERKIWDVMPIIIVTTKIENRYRGADILEGFWRYFVIKNVGKGPAYITFLNENDVNNLN